MIIFNIMSKASDLCVDIETFYLCLFLLHRLMCNEWRERGVGTDEALVRWEGGK